MCRYSYRSGACAHRLVESLECVGEDNCEHSSLNVMTRRGGAEQPGSCGVDRWVGLYCEKHGRFFCPGKEGCATPEDYHRNLTSVSGPLGRRPSEE